MKTDAMQPSKNGSVYVFGPIHMFGKDYLPVYKRLMDLCEPHFEQVIGTYPDFWDSKETPIEFYKRTYETITECDLFISEISSPSAGVGMEMQMGQEHNIPCICLCKKGVEPSVMYLGIPCTKRVIYYSDFDDLDKQLTKAISDHKAGTL